MITYLHYLLRVRIISSRSVYRNGFCFSLIGTQSLGDYSWS